MPYSPATPVRPDRSTMAALADGARLAPALPYIAHELSGLDAAIRRRVFAALEAGELTPEVALAAWMETKSLHDLQRRIEKRIAMGTAAAVAAAPHMEGDR